MTRKPFNKSLKHSKNISEYQIHAAQKCIARFWKHRTNKTYLIVSNLINLNFTKSFINSMESCKDLIKFLSSKQIILAIKKCLERFYWISSKLPNTNIPQDFPKKMYISMFLNAYIQVFSSDSILGNKKENIAKNLQEVATSLLEVFHLFMDTV